MFTPGGFASDFCQECIKTVLGKWLRITDDNPFDSQHKPLNEANKIYQPYQFKDVIKTRNQMNQITGLMKGLGEQDDMCKTLAERLGVAEDQVATIAFSHLLQATEVKSRS